MTKWKKISFLRMQESIFSAGFEIPSFEEMTSTVSFHTASFAGMTKKTYFSEGLNYN